MIRQKTKLYPLDEVEHKELGFCKVYDELGSGKVRVLTGYQDKEWVLVDKKDLKRVKWKRKQ